MSEIPLLDDGTLKFRVKRPDGAETEHSVDLLVLKLTCEACEEQHRLQTVEGRLQPTPAFLADLAVQLGGLGLAPCTPTLAWQAWIACGEQMGRLGNAHSEKPN